MKKALIVKRILPFVTDHDMFNVLICWVGIGGAYYKNVHEIDGRTLKHLETDSMTMSRSSSKAVYLKGEVFVFLRLNRLQILKEIYS